MKNAHYRAATLFERIHLYLGVPVIVLSSIVGTAVFASLQKSLVSTVQISVGLLSIVAAVLASLQTFLRYSERAEKHRIAGAKYGALNVDLELLESLPPADPDTLKQILGDFAVRWNKVREESPTIPDRLWRRIHATESREAPPSIGVSASVSATSLSSPEQESP
jgi:hypothetical protein